MDDSDVIISSTEIIKDRLYFATLKTGYKPKPTRNSKYFHIEDDIVYENFYFDFGPYHLCHLYQFCNKLTAELERSPKKKIVFYTSNNETLRLNAAYLIGSYQIIYLDASPGAVYKQLTDGSEWSLLAFRDASGGLSPFDISLLHVLQGVKVAFDAGFFNFDHFDADQYLFYEKVENGDLNWIVPGKMLAFSGPHHRSRLDHGYPLHSPEHYHEYFRKHYVTTVVRLNKKSYDARQFTAHGFEHRELFFVDGSVPSDIIVNRFLRVAEAAKGAVAVHCKAGLGRTGTLIACYMMKHYGFTSREAIAWLRVCRPGSVIGHQQWFLDNIQSRMHAEGKAYRRRHNMTTFPVCSRGIYSDLPEPERTESEKPVSLQTILHSSTNGNTEQLDNANALNGNPAAAPPRAAPPAPAPPPPAKPRAPHKAHYYQAKTATFPPGRQAAQAKLAAAKPLVKSFQRANLARPVGYAHNASPLKTFARKGAKDGKDVGSVASVTTTLSALTENCHLNGKNRLPSEPNLKTATQTKASEGVARKKILVRSDSSSRKKLPRNVNPQPAGDGPDPLEAPFRFRRKRDKSSSPEPMECAATSADDCDEATDSQGNKLYKIKALRKKCPAFGVGLMKKNGVQTRSSSCAGCPNVKKK